MAKKSGKAKRDKSPQTSKQSQSTGATNAPDSQLVQSQPDNHDEFLIVGIGASAGGLEALTALLDATPDDLDMALVVVQHLDPTKQSLTAELLDKHTAMTVTQVADDVRAEPNHVYVIPPNKSLTISAGKLRLSEPQQRRGVRVPIDLFLRALADDCRERAVAVILSGTGTDGTLGAKAVKSLGGLVIAQDPSTAGHAGMPQSVIDMGIVDRILSPAEIPDLLLSYARHDFQSEADEASKLAAHARPDLGGIIALLRTRANFDFRCYKETTLIRRTRRRMGLLGIGNIAEYRAYLRGHDKEVRALMKDLLISVTDFFRDAEAWLTLEEEVVAPLASGKRADEPFRIWVPGCATGEEALSAAMLVSEQLQVTNKHGPLQVFASDVDKEALDYARQGRYPSSIATDVSAARLKRFFVHVDGDHHYQLKKELRDQLVFAEQNLVADPPFSNLDLICCRNLLIYLNQDVQRKVIALFHFALREGGYLFLGNAETIGTHDELFDVVSKKWRIYRRKGAARHDIVDFPIAGHPIPELEAVPAPTKRRELRLAQLAQQRLIDWIAPQAVLIDRRWQILYYSGDTDPYLTHSPGSATQDVLAKCRPGLRTRLRAAVQKALHTQETVHATARVKRGGHFCQVRLTARPIRDQEHGETLVLLLFADQPGTTRPRASDAAAGERDDAATSSQNNASGNDSDDAADADVVIRQLEDELAETKEDLQATIEQLETTNEESKATSEEVMSINEELQSTNEELETSKEELQSMNEELNTVNAQLANKVEELESSNDDLNNLIRSTEIPTICLDRKMHIKWFTPATSGLMHIVPTDIGRPLSDFSHKLAHDNLLSDARRVLDHLAPVEAEVTVDEMAAERRSYLRRIVPYRTDDDHIAGVVITLVDITERKRAQRLIEAKELADKIIDTVREPMLVLDPDLRVVSANETFYRKFQIVPAETVGKLVYEFDDCQWDIPQLRQLLEDVLSENHNFADFEVELKFARIGHRIMRLNGRRVDEHQLILMAIDDVTALKESARQNSERVQLLDIIHDIAEAANKARTVEQALEVSLQRIGEYNHWRLGHVWRLAEDDSQVMVSSGIWHISDAWGHSGRGISADEHELLADFQRITAAHRIAAGEGLIGRVMQTGKPQWVEDISDFPGWRREGAERLDLGAAMAFPIAVDSNVAAVIEFFSDRIMQREERFMEIMPSIGIHLGHVFERKRLEKMIADATSAQQRHFGRELHDSVAQELTGIGMMAATLHQKLTAASSPLVDQAGQLVGHLRQAHEQVSRLCHGLMPVDVDAEGLMAALEQLVEDCNEMHEVECVFQCNERITVEDNDTATHLYRIAQEAMQNAHKHAHPHHIVVRLEHVDGDVRLTVQDDGDGLSLPAGMSRGTGLRIMQYRANLIGASLEIKSNQGAGLMVICTLSERASK